MIGFAQKYCMNTQYYLNHGLARSIFFEHTNQGSGIDKPHKAILVTLAAAIATVAAFLI
jgi:hypothetical protein